MYNTEIYYAKRGKRYIPVNDPYAYEGLSEGSWLVIVKPGSKSIRKSINPSFIELEAALGYLESGICDAMSKAGELRSSNRTITPKEQKAWKAFRKIMGKDMPALFEYASYYDIVAKGREYILKVMSESNMDIKKIAKKCIPDNHSSNAIMDLKVE